MAEDAPAPPKRKRGQPTKLTPERVAKLVEGIKLGLTFRLACGYARIAYSTFCMWRVRGEEDRERKRQTPFVEFLDQIHGAESEVAGLLVGRIQAAAKKDWRAAAFLIERRHPEEYGRTRMELTGADGDPIGVEHSGGVRWVANLPLPAKDSQAWLDAAQTESEKKSPGNPSPDLKPDS